MWIFGYGSLLWKVDFPYSRKLVGYIKGYSRRFWQASIDHRGIPEKPGRVVTLIPSENPEERVWGIAYEIPEDKEEQVIAHLDFREKCGYEMVDVVFHPKEQQCSPFQLHIYLGTEDNPYFCGGESLIDVASVIAESVGPSGSNTEYLFNLVAALRALYVEIGYKESLHDTHLHELERTVRKLTSY